MELENWQFLLLFVTPIIAAGIAIWKMSSWTTSIDLRLGFLEEATKAVREDIKKLLSHLQKSAADFFWMAEERVISDLSNRSMNTSPLKPISQQNQLTSSPYRA